MSTNWWGDAWNVFWGTSWTETALAGTTQPVYGAPFITGQATISPTLSFTSEIVPTITREAPFGELS